MKTVHFAFGNSGLAVELPVGFDYKIVDSRAAPALGDERASICGAVRSPVAGPSLYEMARGRGTAAIAVCDVTRPAPNSITLPPLLEELHSAGVPRNGVTIIIATGLHRGATPEELVAILGRSVASNYRVVNHDAKDAAAHRGLGTTRSGTPVFLDRRFLDAEIRITLGLIEPHLMLGFSGGRKLIAPGVAGEQTIKVIHSPRYMREPEATEGSIEENPLHAELLEIAAMAGHDFMLDVTLTQERRISGVFAGSPREAHAAGVNFLRDTSLTHLNEAADVVITSGAGHPLDLTFYQTIKGITAARHVLKPGGRIVVLSECREGIGSSEFAEMLETYSGAQGYLDSLWGTEVRPDQWQLEKLALTALQCELFFYTPGVRRDQLGSLGLRQYDHPLAAIGAALAGLGRGSRIAVLPEGPYTFARVRPTACAGRSSA